MAKTRSQAVTAHALNSKPNSGRIEKSKLRRGRPGRRELQAMRNQDLIEQEANKEKPQASIETPQVNDAHDTPPAPEEIKQPSRSRRKLERIPVSENFTWDQRHAKQRRLDDIEVMRNFILASIKQKFDDVKDDLKKSNKGLQKELQRRGDALFEDLQEQGDSNFEDIKGQLEDANKKVAEMAAEMKAMKERMDIQQRCGIRGPPPIKEDSD